MTSQTGARHLAESQKWLAWQRDERKAELDRWTWLRGNKAGFLRFYEQLPKLERREAA